MFFSFNLHKGKFIKLFVTNALFARDEFSPSFFLTESRSSLLSLDSLLSESSAMGESRLKELSFVIDCFLTGEPPSTALNFI